MNIGAFFSGGVDPYWPHFALIGVSLLGSAAVTWGLVRDAENFWSLTNLLIIGGVVLEAICTILLFGFDEGISNSQQSKIIALETRLAPRELSPDQQLFVATFIRPFAGTSFDMSMHVDIEPMRLLGEIEAAMVAGG